ncbi:MAG: hypothetical protein JKY65_06355 [Planctomycetes bacterium]|nr:hypothetical protein [Planctomycetota bacterium]
MSGVLVKAGIGVFLVVAAAKMGGLATDLLGRARESVQASELLTLDKHLAVWAIERKRTRPPRDQGHFNEVVQGLFTTRGKRDVTKDRWGEAYVYEKLGERPVAWRISSKGPDKTLGTADDLVLKRHEDHVQINRDPEEIMKGAIEDKRKADARFLRDLKRLVNRDKKKTPIEVFPAGTAPDPSETEALGVRREGEALGALLGA